MKAVVFRAPNQIVLEERDWLAVGEGDVLLRVRACGVCGTDIHILHGEHIVEFPVIPGHEFSGEVVEVGSGVKSVGVGDRITVDPNIVCRACYFCRRGEVNLCENLRAVGVNYDGGFAEFCRVPAAQCYRVGSSISFEEAAMAEPLACCIHGMDRAGVRPGDNVVVLGAGSIGLMLVQLALAAGAGQVIVSEPNAEKRGLAAGFGAQVQLDPREDDVVGAVRELTHVGADVVIESAGRLETAELAMALVRRGGTILQFGVVSPGASARISPYDVYYREITIRGSFVNPFTHGRAVELLGLGLVKVLPLITHRFTLLETAAAIEAAQSERAVKVLIVSV